MRAGGKTGGGRFLLRYSKEPGLFVCNWSEGTGVCVRERGGGLQYLGSSLCVPHADAERADAGQRQEAQRTRMGFFSNRTKRDYAPLLSPSAPRSEQSVSNASVAAGGPQQPAETTSPVRVVIEANLQHDLEEEAAIRTRAVRPWHQPALSYFLALTMVASLCIGLVFGWPSFALILEAEGVYSGRDEDGRAVGFTLLYTLATSALAFGGVPAGLLIEKVGPARSAAVAGAMISAGLAGLALFPPGADDAFAVPLMLLGGGGILTCFVGFRAAPLTQHPLLVMISVNTLFQTSSAVPVLYYLLYDSVGLSRRMVFGGAACYAATLYAAWAAGWFKFEPFLSAAAAASGAGGGASEGGKSAAAAPPSAVSIRPVESHGRLVDALRSVQFGGGLLWFISHQWRSNLYLGEVRCSFIRLLSFPM